MIPFEFQFADLLDESLLFLSVDGRIEHANRSALALLNADWDQLAHQPIGSFLSDPPDRVREFLHTCSRTRQFVPGAMNFVVHGRSTSCRCDGAVLDSGNQGRIVLRLQKRGSLKDLDALSGGGTMGALIRRHDWNKTPLGRIETWPQSLLTAASICLSSKFPMILWWGSQLCVLYNDAYIPIFAAKHPFVLGKTGLEAWGEVWDVIGPMLNSVLEHGNATWSDDQLLLLNRNGYLEETYFTWSYSPIRDEGGGVGGVFSAVFETTNRVLIERRLRTLRELSQGNAKAVPEACTSAINVLARNHADVPFAMLYLAERGGEGLVLAGHTGVSAETGEKHASIAQIGSWPFEKAFTAAEAVIVSEPAHILGEVSGGSWPEPPSQAIALPIMGSEQDRPVGVFIMGVNPRRALDEDYRGFCQLVARQIATYITNAKAYEDERKRAEGLAEIDRAKTAFFSNVSHEFRTPLTLMIGPVEDALTASGGSLSGEGLLSVHRNGLRLLKLVNTILDFSRIEAGRVDAVFEPTNLARSTAELAGSFESAMSRAGLRYTIQTDCSTEAWIDGDMWEKIVLNLVSNAFKYTLQGEVRISLEELEDQFRLTVADTGIGIPADEIQHVFERFHRVRGAQGRTVEGTGIGLALVNELVRLHGGNIQCRSTVGEGTAFVVSIPKGSAHLPAEKLQARRALAPTAVGAQSFVQEALRWLPAADRRDLETTPAEEAPPPFDPEFLKTIKADARFKILIADDNADMRDYLMRLLSATFDVQSVSDGEAAVKAALKFKPDLILSDVMMPVLDGFQTLQALRNNPETRTIPFILLSARAGDEAKVEGLQAGADDYLVKPFHSRELTARVTAHLTLSRMRKEIADRERELREEAERANRAKDEFLAVVSHEIRTPLTPILGWTRILRSRNVSSETLEKGLSIIERNTQAQSKLIEDLLDMSRISAGKIVLEYRNVVLREVLESSIETARQFAEEKNVQMILAAEDSVPPVWGDPDRLKQIFSNLITNAVKFCREGGKVEVRLTSHGDRAQVDVIDDGAGIDPGFLPKIFDRFSQFDSTTTRRFGGLGIGLSVVRDLTQLHGGAVRASSGGLNQGATFTVEIPVSQKAAIVGDDQKAYAVRPGREALIGKAILVVDDEADAREFVCFALESCGARPTAAASVQEALAACDVQSFDIVVTDIAMPHQDGFDLLRTLRQRGLSIPAIAVTAFARSEDRWRALSAGFDRHLAKPIDPDDLCAAVNASLSVASAARLKRDVAATQIVAGRRDSTFRRTPAEDA